MVQVDGEKMSKSLGNFTTLADLLDHWDPRALRLLVLQTHYRHTMEIGAEALDGAVAALGRLDAFTDRATAAELPTAPPDTEVIDRFRNAMDDDLGTPVAVAVLFDAVRDANRALDDADTSQAGGLAAAVDSVTRAIGLVLGRAHRPGGSHEDVAEVEGLVAAREAAREASDYDEADRIRAELTGRGIVVEDSVRGTIWHRA